MSENERTNELELLNDSEYKFVHVWDTHTNPSRKIYILYTDADRERARKQERKKMAHYEIERYLYRLSESSYIYIYKYILWTSDGVVSVNIVLNVNFLSCSHFAVFCQSINRRMDWMAWTLTYTPLLLLLLL